MRHPRRAYVHFLVHVDRALVLSRKYKTQGSASRVNASLTSGCSCLNTRSGLSCGIAGTVMACNPDRLPQISLRSPGKIGGKRTVDQCWVFESSVRLPSFRSRSVTSSPAQRNPVERTGGQIVRVLLAPSYPVMRQSTRMNTLDIE